MRCIYFGRLAAALCLIFSGLGLAATPESGTLTIDSGPVEFGNGPNVGVNVTPAGTGPECIDVVLPCDHFALTIDLPENIADVFPTALVRMSFGWDDLTGAGVEDYDIYLYDADGNELNSAATSGNPEVMVQLAQGGVREFRIDIIYFAVVGSNYTGTIELDLGEPADGADVDEFFMQNSVVHNVLSPRAAQADPEQTALGRRGAGGAAGGSLLLVVAGLLARRRV